MPDTFEPDSDGGNRVRRRMAVAYAVAAVLLLVVCCFGAFWFSASLRDALADLH